MNHLSNTWEGYSREYKLADLCYDANGNLIGKYLFLPDSRFQKEFDDFMTQFIKNAKLYNDPDKGFSLSIDLETQGRDPHQHRIILISISWDEDTALVFVPDNFDLTLFIELLSIVLIDNHNLKFDMKFLWKNYDVEPRPRICTMEGARLAYCGYSEMDRYSLQMLCKKRLNIKVNKSETLDFTHMVPKINELGFTEWVGATESDKDLLDEHIRYAACDTILQKRLVRSIADRLVSQELYDVYTSQERQLISVLSHTELIGIKLNKEYVNKLLDDCKEHIVKNFEIMQKYYDQYASEETKAYVSTKGQKEKKGKFNIKSVNQLRLLLTDLGVLVKSTEAEEIERVLGTLTINDPGYHFIKALQDFKDYAALVEKYLDPWSKRVAESPTNRLHPHFNIITPSAETGRLCMDGNTLVRTPAGFKKIKDFVEGDYVISHLNRPKKVLHLIQKGVEKMYKVSYKGGYFICTLEHRFLTLEGWKSLSQVGAGAFLIAWESDKGIFQTRINRVTELDERMVWDITVEDDHSYFASGVGPCVVQHNSAEGINVMALSKGIRGVIGADEGCYIVSLDYSQYELRSVAANANEPRMLEIFETRAEQLPDLIEIAGKYGQHDVDHFVKKHTKFELTPGEVEKCIAFGLTDIHKINGGFLFGKPAHEVGDVERDVSKTLTYAVLYQAGINQIQQQLYAKGYTFTTTQCKEFQQSFYKIYPRLEPYIKDTQKLVNKLPDGSPGFIETFLGRKKYFTLPERWKKEEYLKRRADALRKAVNAKQQCANVDATKLAMVRLNSYLKENYFEDWKKGITMILMPVHDEIVSQCRKDYVNEYIQKKREIMVEAGLESVDRRVPIEVSATYGLSWDK